MRANLKGLGSDLKIKSIFDFELKNKYFLKGLVILFLLTRIRIRTDQILRIRIRKKSMRIRNPAPNPP